MADLLSLSNELIVLIASYMSKPSDLLRFALVSRGLHRIVIQHLYENVIFDRDDYPSYLESSNNLSKVLENASMLVLEHPSALVRSDYGAPHSNVLRLSKMIQSKALPAGQTVTSLTLILGVNRDYNQFQTTLSLLLPQLCSLKSLTLKSVSEDLLAWQHESFSLAPLAVALSALNQTLQRLDLHFSLDPETSDGQTIGSLQDFLKLKYLSIQGSVLLGRYNRPVPQIPLLDSILPPGLKCLRLHWCTFRLFPELCLLLVKFVSDSIISSRKTEKVTIQLNTEIHNPSEPTLVRIFESTLPIMTAKARRGGLELELALEYPWARNAYPYPEVVYLFSEDTPMEQLRKFIEEFTPSPSSHFCREWLSGMSR